jgi:outer membrane protein
MRRNGIRACLLAALVTASGTGVSVFAQAPGQPRPSDAAPQVRQLTEDEAVKLALENNLGIRIARFEPQVEDLSIVQAQASWTPTFRSTFSTNSSTQPNRSVFTGSSGSTLSSDRLQTNFGIAQTLPRFGSSFDVGWNNSKFSTNQNLATFPEELETNLQARFTQPLLRNFSIDNIRQQLAISLKNREIADIDVRQTTESTIRTVRNSYWNLAYQIAFLDVQRQSLELARESLRNTRTRIEIGTTPPIEEVSAQAEVATREEAVIVAEAQIATAEDTLRALIFDPSMPDYWTIQIRPGGLPSAITATPIDVDSAMRNALTRRTDLDASRKSLEANQVNIRYLRNQTLPDVTATFDYRAVGLGGTRNQYGQGPLGPGTGALESQTQIGFSSALSTLLQSDFPTWTAAVNFSYPLGRSQTDANLARERLRLNQTQTRLRQQEQQIATQVRQAGRQLQTNQQRVQTSRASRELAERRLEAEQRKFEAGTSTSFQVFQAQRDLSQARNNELRAILDYNQSKVDFETVQEVPLGGGGGGGGGGTTTTATAAQ